MLASCPMFSRFGCYGKPTYFQGWPQTLYYFSPWSPVIPIISLIAWSIILKECLCTLISTWLWYDYSYKTSASTAWPAAAVIQHFCEGDLSGRIMKWFMGSWFIWNMNTEYQHSWNSPHYLIVNHCMVMLFTPVSQLEESCNIKAGVMGQFHSEHRN